jgi:phosphoribosylaminoimidazolecarboxamide formyltransferase/IMP cyclohydrolase
MSQQDLVPLRRALISVSDKSGLIDRARQLVAFGVEILSTGGTLKALNEAGIEAHDVSKVTEFPEMMDGRLKTLHPRVHGGLLGRRDREDDRASMQEHGIPDISHELLARCTSLIDDQSVAKLNLPGGRFLRRKEKRIFIS